MLLPQRKATLRMGGRPALHWPIFSSSSSLDSAVEARFAAMTVNERAAQMIMHATSEERGAALPFEKAKDLYAKGLIGVLFLKSDVNILKNKFTLLIRFLESETL